MGILIVLVKKFFKLLNVQLKGTFFLSKNPVYLYSIKISTIPVPFFVSVSLTSSLIISLISFSKNNQKTYSPPHKDSHIS